MSLVLACACGLAAVSLLVALHTARRQRALAEDLLSVRQQLRDLSRRLVSAEKTAEEASSHADAAGSVLLDKGLANEEDLEAARRRAEALDQAQPARGSRTLH